MDSTSQRHGIAAYRLRFSGTGGEYFRVWIVNVLLSIFTLGLYTPWARRRTARYFYDHTLIAGSPGEYNWGGAATTSFWIDPAEELITIFMTQVLPSSAYPIRRELRSMVYAAITESNL